MAEQKEISRIQYTGLNFQQVMEFTGGRVLAPYECMGFSMLSLQTDDGFVTIHEGDWICKDESGNLTVE